MIETHFPVMSSMGIARFTPIVLLLMAMSCKSTTEAGAGKASLSLDGSDDFVQVEASGAPNFGRGDFTWEVWVKRSRAGVREEVLLKKDVLASEHIVVLFVGDDNRAYAYLGETALTQPLVLRSQSAFGSGVWTHLAITRSSGVATLYVNGVAEASYAADYDITSSGPFRIGANRENNAGPEGAPLFNFGGLIREVRLWSVARTAQELNAAMRKPATPGAPGLEAYYPLTDGEGAQARELTGRGGAGSLRNGATWVANDRPF
jgi:hypothetical protein